MSIEPDQYDIVFVRSLKVDYMVLDTLILVSPAYMERVVVAEEDLPSGEDI